MEIHSVSPEKQKQLSRYAIRWDWFVAVSGRDQSPSGGGTRALATPEPTIICQMAEQPSWDLTENAKKS